MRVLVTGATGFIGRALCQVLRRRGWQVSAAVRNQARLPEGCEPLATAVEQQRAATNEIFHNVQKAAAAAGESNEIIIGLTLDAGETSQSTSQVFNSSQASIATTAKLRKAVESFLTHAEAL